MQGKKIILWGDNNETFYQCSKRKSSLHSKHVLILQCCGESEGQTIFLMTAVHLRWTVWCLMAESSIITVGFSWRCKCVKSKVSSFSFEDLELQNASLFTWSLFFFLRAPLVFQYHHITYHIWLWHHMPNLRFGLLIFAGIIRIITHGILKEFVKDKAVKHLSH